MFKETKQPTEGPLIGYPTSTLHKLFEERALLLTESNAIKYEGKPMSYGTLRSNVNQMAHYLWSEGVRPGNVVAVSLDRSPNLIIALLAILECGAGYLPLDPKFPSSRLDFMLKDSESSFLITTKELSTLLPAHSKTMLVEDIMPLLNTYPNTPLTTAVSNSATAYILYTSGSTGKPKGVSVTHKNLVNFLYSMAKEPGIKETDKLLSITTISFDIAGLELFLPLLNGATLVIADHETTRDGHLLLNLLQKEDITILQATPTTWQLLLDAGWKHPLPLKALCGGEALPLNLARQLTSKCLELWNMYGPTETTIWSTIKKIEADDELITIGKPIANTQIYIIANDQLVAPGQVGEIVIGGDGVALGYWNRPDLTAEKFIINPFSKDDAKTLYRTGDLGKHLPNGEIQCLGRMDQQIKIRGHRVELGEIETSLNSLPGIKQSAVVLHNHSAGERLVAYLKSGKDSPNEKTIRHELTKILPDLLIPSHYMFVDDFPMTPNGKIDKKNLPNIEIEYVRPDSAPPLKKPRTEFEKKTAAIWSEQLHIPVIGIDDNFFDLGGTSVLAQKVTVLMIEQLSLDISVSKIYTHPTISELSKFSGNGAKKEDSFVLKKYSDKKYSGDIAIIGMSGRFPGANSIDELWNVLKNGKETISHFTKEELDPSIPDSLRNDPLYVAARGVLPSAKTFDAAFFGLNPQLAAVMDPQIRIFLELCWEALEQSGHLPAHYKGSIGVWGGSEFNTYYENNILPNKEVKDQIGYWQTYTVNAKDFIGPRVAYHLNLQGPAVSVHSACSTSLLAVAEAVKAIRTGMCDVALAGGSSVNSPINCGHLYDDGFIKSPNGSTRPFDASGKGTVFSDGAGVVLLKSLDAAKKDGDIIYGLIKGVGVNNDGGEKGSFMAPSSKGQAGAIINAFNDAQVSPSTISYLEAHGTATPVGDPIEIEGLKIAFGKLEKKSYCALGSIKSNFGHTTAAAGVAGLIKTILAMRHKQIPPMVGFNKPNPAIDFSDSPFYINNKLTDWKVDGPRRAGISSFGVGSTNVHVIVEEYEMEPQKQSANERPLQLLTWSAKNQNSLSGYETALGSFLSTSPKTPLADVAYSLNITRDDFSHRSFLIADKTIEAAKNLNTSKLKATKSSILKVAPSEMGFLFPGQGAQYLQMGKTLYNNEKVYRDAIDECAELLNDSLKLDIRKIIYPETNSIEAEELLKNTRLTQPAIFVTEYALSQLWMSWGIKPTLLCGHSIGEFVAAHLAGVINLKDALHIIATRGRLVSELPGGTMLSVRLPEDQLKDILPKTLSIAAINSKHLCVVAGSDKDIEAFVKTIEPQDIPHRILFTSHAFHSSMMDPILEDFRKALEKVKLSVPRLPIISTVTGTWLTDTEATSVTYWVNHLRNTVRFADAIDTVLEQDDFILLEVGPGQSLTTLARQQATGKIISAFSSLTFPKDEDDNEYATLLNTLGELWLRGVNPDWKSFYSEQERQKINLPSYVFDRKPCWIDAIINHTTTVVQKSVVQETSLVSEISESMTTTNNDTNRASTLLNRVLEIITDSSGITFGLDSVSNTFLELGLDSLTITQLSGRLKKEFNLPFTFRKLNEEFATPSLLADYLNENLPEEKSVEIPKTHTVSKQNSETSSIQETSITSNKNQITMEQIAQQIQLLSKQIEALQNNYYMPKNGTSPVTNIMAKPFVSIDTNKDNIIRTNGHGHNLQKNVDVSKNIKNESATNISKKEYSVLSSKPPMIGAKLGRDEHGNPAWFIADSDQEGKYVKINI